MAPLSGDKAKALSMPFLMKYSARSGIADMVYIPTRLQPDNHSITIQLQTVFSPESCAIRQQAVMEA